MEALPLAPQYPTDQDIEHLVRESSMGSTLPAALMRRLIQNYVRLASQVTPVCVFDCQAWTTLEEEGDLFSNQADCVIPFVTSIEIGLIAAAEMFRVNHDEHASLIDILNVRDFASFTPTDLTISSVTSSIGERPQDVESIEMQDSFLTFSLNNLPNDSGDLQTTIFDENGETPTVPNAPNSQWLVQYARPRTAIAELIRKPKKSARDLEMIMEGLRSPEGMQPPRHVERVEVRVTNPQDAFHVMIDGRLFGPFKRIRVSPSQAWQDSDVVIPIMSFFPVIS